MTSRDLPNRCNLSSSRAWLGLAAVLCLGLPPGAAQAGPSEKARLVLQADRTSYSAGSSAHLAALVSIEPGWHINSHTPTYDFLIPTMLEISVPPGWSQAGVRYPAAEVKSFAFADKPLSVYEGDVEIQGEVAIPEGTGQGSFPLAVTFGYQACDQSQCLPPVTTRASLSILVGAAGAAISPATAHGSAPGLPSGQAAAPHQPTPAAGTSRSGLAGILLLAVLGGLILNAMPCVLPVLSLKVFGLVRSAAGGRSAVVRGTLATAAGIMTSFWLLAGAAVAAAAAGAAVGWGVQFQRPGFVTFLAVVVLLFCLNLWGLFEIPLPGALARAAGSASGEGEGAASHFASGLFATLMATPCSAPFLGTAVGFALAQQALVVFAVFTAVGLGMALPYLLLAVAPGAVRLLPRPGTWMETVRGAMGFLLAASVVWLLYVLSLQVSPERLSAVELGLVAISLFTWLGRRIAQAAAEGSAAGGSRQGGTARSVRKTAAALGLAATIVTTLSIAAWSGAGQPAAGASRATGGAADRGAAGLIRWVAFDRRRAESLAASGRLVFVDVTAAWCFTCKVNERLTIDTPEVAGAFSAHQVLPMRADWTNRSDEIGAFLASYGRYGIPFYLLYRPGRPPHVFSEVPSKEAIITAVREAAQAIS